MAKKQSADKKSIWASLKGKLLAVAADVREHWDKPREGEFVTDRQFVNYTFSNFFTALWSIGPGLIGGFCMGWFCGSMMGIAMKDFVSVGLIGTILSYIILVFSPLGMLIYENHGVLTHKQTIVMHLYCSVRIVLGIGCYLLPSDFMQSFVRGFPYLLGNILLFGGVLDYINWFVRRFFCAKYGRVKPFVVLYALPAVILGCLLPWINFARYNYSVKIAILHAYFWIMGTFAGGLQSAPNMLNFMTQNTQERQRISVYGNLLRFAGSSIIGMFIPTIITKSTLFGHTLMGYEDIWSYRILAPIFGSMTLIGLIFILPVRENLVEQHVDRPRVEFFRGAKNVFKNKYFWLSSFSGITGFLGGIMGNLLTFWMVYQRRNAWLMGLVGGFISFGGTLGNIFVPTITKRVDKIKMYKVGRVFSIFVAIVQVAMYKLDLFWPYIILSFVFNPIRTILETGAHTMGGDVLDYHQWKYGERADSISGVMGWIFNPASTLLGYICPYIYSRLGYTSDWAMFNNTAYFRRIFDYTIIMSILSSILSAIPYVLFYDLYPYKHKQYVEELVERTRLQDIARIEEHKRLGSIHLVPPALLAKYGYDSEGNKLPEVEAEVEVADNATAEV